MDGFNGKAFQTAARRRGGHPLETVLEVTIFDDDGRNPRDVDVLLRIDPYLDSLRLGAMLGPTGEAIRALQDPAQNNVQSLLTMDVEAEKARDAFTLILLPDCRAQWNEVAHAVDIGALSDLVIWLRQELSGLDPTQPGSSPDGSPATGVSSPDGVEPGTSTSELSLSTTP